MNLRTALQMENLSPTDQAKKAIAHVLNQRRNNPQLAYWIAPGSQSFALLTEAAATLFGRPVAEVRDNFSDADTVDPDAWRLALEWIVRVCVPDCSTSCGSCAACVANRALRGAK